MTAPAGRPPTCSRVSWKGTTEKSCRSTLLVVEAVRRTHCTPGGGHDVELGRLGAEAEAAGHALGATGPQATGMTALTRMRSRLARLIARSLARGAAILASEEGERQRVPGADLWAQGRKTRTPDQAMARQLLDS